MKQNNKFNKFGRNNAPEKTIRCSCGSRAKIKTRMNYPHGKKSKAVKSTFYKCDKCGEVKFATREQKGGRK